MDDAAAQVAIDAAWRRVEDTWDDDQAHRVFVATCLRHNQLPEAGRRYKAVRDGGPSRRAEAERRIEGLIALALSTMRDQRTEPSRSPHRALLITTIALCAVLLGILVWTFTKAMLSR